MPNGNASTRVNIASNQVCPRLSNIKCRRVTPSAHSGASCPRRLWLCVNRLMNSATPATHSVRLLSAAVAAKVRSKTCVDQPLSRA
ncbi:hypothetical protein D3C86_1940470 [compost metagenome]